MGDKLLIKSSSAEMLKTLSKSARSKKKRYLKEEEAKCSAWMKELEAMDDKREDKIALATKRLQEGHYQSTEAQEKLLDKFLL